MRDHRFGLDLEARLEDAEFVALPLAVERNVLVAERRLGAEVYLVFTQCHIVSEPYPAEDAYQR